MYRNSRRHGRDIDTFIQSLNPLSGELLWLWNENGEKCWCWVEHTRLLAFFVFGSSLFKGKLKVPYLIFLLMAIKLCENISITVKIFLLLTCSWLNALVMRLQVAIVIYSSYGIILAYILPVGHSPQNRTLAITSKHHMNSHGHESRFSSFERPEILWKIHSRRLHSLCLWKTDSKSSHRK